MPFKKERIGYEQPGDGARLDCSSLATSAFIQMSLQLYGIPDGQASLACQASCLTLEPLTSWTSYKVAAWNTAWMGMTPHGHWFMWKCSPNGSADFNLGKWVCDLILEICQTMLGTASHKIALHFKYSAMWIAALVCQAKKCLPDGIKLLPVALLLAHSFINC